VPQPEFGSLRVTKDVIRPETVTTEFEICIEPVRSLYGIPAFPWCEHLEDGESHTFTGLVPGDYRVFERGAEGYVVTVTPAAVVAVTAGARTDVTVTNTWTPELGSLRVFKNVVRVGYTPTAFTICIEPVLEPRTPQPWPRCESIIGNGESYTFGGLTPGDYRVTEVPVPDGYTVNVTPASVVEVTAGGRTDVTVTNTWREIPPPPPPPPTTGAVQLIKEVEGTPAEGEDIDGTFELCLTGPVPATTEICRTVETIDGVGSTIVAGLTPGTYTVGETDPGEGYVVEILDNEVTVVAGGLDTATVTNTLLEDNEEPIIPPVTPPEEEDSDSGGPVPTPTPLPQTGIELTLALVATATLGAGVLLLTVARRRTIR
jgi:uncharacterized surface anchored protein